MATTLFFFVRFDIPSYSYCLFALSLWQSHSFSYLMLLQYPTTLAFYQNVIRASS